MSQEIHTRSCCFFSAPIPSTPTPYPQISHKNLSVTHSNWKHVRVKSWDIEFSLVTMTHYKATTVNPSSAYAVHHSLSHILCPNENCSKVMLQPDMIQSSTCSPNTVALFLIRGYKVPFCVIFLLAESQPL